MVVRAEKLDTHLPVCSSTIITQQQRLTAPNAKQNCVLQTLGPADITTAIACLYPALAMHATFPTCELVICVQDVVYRTVCTRHNGISRRWRTAQL